jgi:hypothetical protein
MKVAIGTFDHYCTEAGECGEILDNPEGLAVKVRKYVILKDGKRIRSRAFHTREQAAERARKMGFEVEE